MDQKKIKVVFLGNHDVGIKSIKAILKDADLVGIVAHPLDSEEGIVFKSVYDFAIKLNIDVIRGRGKDKVVYDFIADKKPDLLWITDYKYILPKEVIELAKCGAVNLHPSLLPKYRGRAPVNWAIIEGESEIGITAHYIDEGVDTGDIIEQFRIDISSGDYIDHILTKLYPLYTQITSTVLKQFSEKKVKALPQPNGEFKKYPRRTRKDGLINWGASVLEIYNLIRAVSKPYPGAYTKIDNQELIIWKASIIPKNEVFKNKSNGYFLKENDLYYFNCSDGVLVALEWEFLDFEAE